MKPHLTFSLGTLWLAAVVCAADAPAPELAGRWPVAQAWAWYQQQPWLVGCNFLPSTAVNDVEMWQPDTFDTATIDRELGWARELGFNTVRVFLNYIVWEGDAAGFKQRLQQFLELADRHGIRVMFILFDDCFKPEPQRGPQPDPEPGVHNSQWVQSPGARRRGDQAQWGPLEQYVKDIVGSFGQDRRVVIWDLYNEPSQSRALVEATFRWARAVHPSQPLTSCWLGVEYSDILSFHSYGDLKSLREEIDKLQPNRRGRPYICTEWLARGGGSRFATHLPYFQTQHIACWNWGLVAGRTQTYFPWGSPKDAPEPKLWHHDILRRDGTPFDPREVRFIQRVTGVRPPIAWTTLVPTSEKQPATWRYTEAQPAENWYAAEFDDGAWQQGAAPFGRPEPQIARQPNTVWSSADLWLRRVIDVPAGAWEVVALRLHHDEDTRVYLNGVLAAEVPGYNAAYEEFEISAEAHAALRPGPNVIAVQCRQTGGGQFIDVGLVAAPAAERDSWRKSK